MENLLGNSDEIAVDLINLRKILPKQASIGERWLSRPFPIGEFKRVLLVFIDDSLAWPQYRAFLRYRDRFRRSGIVFRAMAFNEISRQKLPPDVTAIFLQAPYLPAPGQLESRLELLRSAYPDSPISFFDWFAPTDVRFAATVAPYASSYLKKALLRDVTEYHLHTKGHTQLIDYFGPRHNLPIDPPHWIMEPAIVDRLIAGPSFFTSRSLMPGFERDTVPSTARRPIDIHARIATGGTPWYSAMRQEAKEAISRDLDDLRIVSEGKVSRSKFMAELSHAKLCFSPFGYGELCWRDFEAMLAGSVLVKQDMSHILTAPDVFRDGETYFAVRWDLSDLHDTIRSALAQPERLHAMADNARLAIKNYLAGPALEQLVDRLISAPAYP